MDNNLNDRNTTPMETSLDNGAVSQSETVPTNSGGGGKETLPSPNSLDQNYNDEECGYDTCGTGDCLTRELIPLSSVTVPPTHPHYASEAERLKTFYNWPNGLSVRPEALAEAGFFYTGFSDKTRCFYCNGGLTSWIDGDIPWEEHARWMYRCPYVNLVKGKAFVEKVNSRPSLDYTEKLKNDTERESKIAAKHTQKAQTSTTDIDEAMLCKICHQNEQNVCFVPCGHVIACAKCALALNACPVCRSAFTHITRLYYV